MITSSIAGGSNIDKPLQAYKIVFNTPDLLKEIELMGIETVVEHAKTRIEETIREIYLYSK